MSDSSFKARKAKLQAICLFLQWLRNQLHGPREHLFEGDDPAFLRAMNHCLVTGILSQGSLPALANWRLVLHTRTQVCQRSRLALMKYIAIAGLNEGMSSLGRAAQAALRRATATW